MAEHDTTSAVDGSDHSDWGLAPRSTRSRTETKIGLSLVVVLLAALAFLVYRKINNQGLTIAAADDAPRPALQLEGDDSSATPEGSGSSDEHFIAPTPQATPIEFDTADTTDGGVTGPPPGQFEPSSSMTADSPRPSPASAPTASTDPWMTGGVPSTGGPTSQPAPAEPNPFVSDAAPLPAANTRNSNFTENDRQSWSSDAGGSVPQAFPEPATDVAAPPMADGPVFDLFGGDSAATAEPAPAQEAIAQEPPPRNEPLLIDAAPREVIPTGGDDIGAIEVDQAGGDGGAWDLSSPEGVDDPFGDPAPVNTAPQPPVEFDLDTNAGDPTPVPEPEYNLEPTPAPTFTPPPAENDAGSGTPWSSPTNTVQRPAPMSDPFVGGAGGMATFDDDVTIYTVQSRDSFWSISRQHYGSGKYFNALAAYNRPRIPNPRDMRPGMKVLIPDAGVLEQRFPNLAGVSYSPSREQKQPGFFVSTTGQPMYRVGKNDTLSSIAVRHLGRASRWRQIYGMNSSALKGADSLKIGMELRLPPDATRVTVVPSNVSVR